MLDALSATAAGVWLDGGWGVDALPGEQTRPHDDLDAVVGLADADLATAALAGIGFCVSEDDRPMRLVLEDARSRRIECHLVVIDSGGTGRQPGAGPGGGDAIYPAGGFAGAGSIRGRNVNCLTPELLVRHHLGYEPQDKDRHNVRLLCECFGIKLPGAYR